MAYILSQMKYKRKKKPDYFHPTSRKGRTVNKKCKIATRKLMPTLNYNNTKLFSRSKLNIEFYSYPLPSERLFPAFIST